MAVKIIFLLKRRPDLSTAAFRQHYEQSHVPLAESYIKHLLLGYRRNYPIFATLNPSAQPAGLPPKPAEIEYDAITEMWVRDQAAVTEMTRIFADPAISKLLAEDEVKFLSRKDTL